MGPPECGCRNVKRIRHRTDRSGSRTGVRLSSGKGVRRMSGRPKAMPSPEAPWLAAGSGTKVPSFVGRPPGRNAKAGTGLWPHVLAPLIVVPPGAPENKKKTRRSGGIRVEWHQEDYRKLERPSWLAKTKVIGPRRLRPPRPPKRSDRQRGIRRQRDNNVRPRPEQPPEVWLPAVATST